MAPRTRTRRGLSVAATILRWLGWLLIAAGVLVGLFVVYLLFWTGRDTAAAQQDMLTTWEQQLLPEWELAAGPFDLDGTGSALADIPVIETRSASESDDVPTAVAGEPYALLWFERDGERILVDRVLSVVEGVSVDHLADGPGHYPDTAAPGDAGNFAVAGHRTTFLAPFHDLDQLEEGDEIHVVDRDGNHFVYHFRQLRVVAPDDVWVLGDNPLDGQGDGWLTLTTCHPRFSAAQRLVAFASLGTGQ